MKLEDVLSRASRYQSPDDLPGNEGVEERRNLTWSWVVEVRSGAAIGRRISNAEKRGNRSDQTL